MNDVLGPMWWLSFCNPKAHAGEQFLGACFVRALDFPSAVRIAHVLGINPGGEVQGMEIDREQQAKLSFDLAPYVERFLGRDEAIEFVDRVARELSD